MGTIDYGTQNITFQYQEEASSEAFNNLNYLILPTGIYEGGILTKEGSNLVGISEVQFVISDSSTQTSVKVSTTNSVTIGVTSGTPFVILRWVYASSVNNYVDFLAVAYSDLQTDDLILGRCIYEVGVLQSQFDYTRRTYSYLGSLKSDKDELRVRSTEPYSDKVYVEGGSLYGEVGFITVTPGESPAISDTTLGRIDLVYIDTDGSVGIIEGSDAASPVRPSSNGKFIIAEIERGGSATYVSGDQITQVPITYKQKEAKNITIDDTNGRYTTDYVEDALKEISNDTFTFYGSKTFDDETDFNSATNMLDDVKVEGDLVFYDGVTDQDRNIQFASDANLLWDESEDRFDFDKSINFIISGSKTLKTASILNCYSLISFFPIPSSNTPSGITVDTDNDRLISCYFGINDRIYYHDGLGRPSPSYFSSPSNTPSGVAYDFNSGNLISCDSVTDRIYIHSGVTSSTTSNFLAPYDTPLDIAIHPDTGNLISLNFDGGSPPFETRLYIHDGISATTTSYITLTTGTVYRPKAMTIDSMGNLIAAWEDAGDYVLFIIYDGISTTSLNEFLAPERAMPGLGYDYKRNNLYSIGSDIDYIYAHQLTLGYNGIYTF